MTRFSVTMKFLFFTMSLFFLCSGCLVQLGFSDEENGEMTFCHFGPKFKLVEASYARNRSFNKNDKCSGMAKVQGVYWECAQPGQVEAKVAGFREQLRKQALSECQKHCARRGNNCTGRLLNSGKCGLQTDREDAITLGKRMGCRNDCPGQAFAYCSLYDGAFRSDDSERIAKQPANCECRLK